MKLKFGVKNGFISKRFECVLLLGYVIKLNDYAKEMGST